MNEQDMETILRETLEDRKLSRGERSALKSVIGDLGRDEHNLNLIRHQAFEIAQSELITGQAKQVLDWLKDVVNVLTPSAPSPDSSSVAYFSPQDDCPARLVRLISQARRSLDICVFTITDDRISRAITEVHQRRIPVRIISDNDKSSDLGSDIEKLSDQGIQVRIDNSPYHMHHKFAIFDGTSMMTGSYNWTRSAAKNNEENFVVTDNSDLIVRFKKEFEQLWEKFS